MGHRKVENKIGERGFLNFRPIFGHFSGTLLVFEKFVNLQCSQIWTQGISFESSESHGRLEGFRSQISQKMSSLEPIL